MNVRINYLSITAVALILFASCSKEVDQATVSGAVEEVVPGALVMLEKIELTGPVPVDTFQLRPDGEFELSTNVTQPGFYRLNLNGSDFVSLLINDNNERINVNFTGNRLAGSTDVEGSEGTSQMREIDELMKVFGDEVKRINTEAAVARNSGDLDLFEEKVVEYRKLSAANEKKLKDVIWNSLPSLSAFYGLQQLDGELHYTFFDSVSSELTRELPNNPIVQNLAQMVEVKRSLTIGSEAPDIALENPEGEVIRLSSLRGKYVLVDFWAAWCRPCRAENPNIVNAYNKFKQHNFEVLGVSLDRTREAWLRAIDQDGLPWLHISDLKYWNSVVTRTYQINSIPASYLIGPDGKIVAKNLRGPNLHEKLKEIFGVS